MPTTYDITVSIKESVSGQEAFGAPLTHRITVAEAEGPLLYTQAAGASFVTIPGNIIPQVQLLVLRTDQVANLRLDGQADKGLRFVAGGLLLAAGVTIDVGLATNLLLQTNPTPTAVTNVKAFVGGS